MSKIALIISIINGLLVANLASGASTEISQEESLIQVIADLAIDRRNHDVGRIEELQGTYNLSTDRKDRKIAALALGAHYILDSPKLALQFLTSAKLLTNKDDQVSHIVDFYLAAAMLRLGNYEGSAQLSTQLAKNKNASAWLEKIVPMQIEALFQTGKYDKVFRIFKKYRKNHALNRRQEEIVRFVSMAFSKAGRFKKSFAMNLLIKNRKTSKWRYS